ncbi:hypothetical protein OPV22_005808 [Ensete ventricosum]|uniref:Uncharacterized protein n=1 Tax=Ensete ventricosum TaxID=4639 RepID=A0AAV8QA46_ENSVE|nr:hypothetical protein OPV22_005808 [Ensete ventricosum]
MGIQTYTVAVSIRGGRKDKRHMAISGEELSVHGKKVMVFLFGFLVSVSPVVVCTALLLGLLLSYRAPNIPETEEKMTKGLGKFLP